MALEYPPPRIDELLIAAEISPDALKPSYEDMAGKARELGILIMKAIAPKMPKEVYDVMCIMPRGGFMVNDVLTHAFGFHGSRVQTLGTTAYEEDGKTKAAEVRFTQLPAFEDIVGKSVLLVEDVCDTGHTFNDGKQLLLGENYMAANVTTAAVYYKPDKTKTGFVPDFFVEQTDKWIVFPGEVYEQIGPESLKPELWLP